MAAKSNQFDPTRFDYSLNYDVASPPTLVYIKTSGFSNYWGLSQEAVNRGSYAPTVAPLPSFTQKEYTLWLEGYYENVLKQIRQDANDLREAQKLIDENPVYAKILDLYKRGLL